MQRYFYVVIIMLPLLISGCASQQTSFVHQIVPPVTEKLFWGTWESEPTGTAKAVMTITFLPHGKCFITVRVNGKITNNNDRGTYTLNHNSVIIHAKMVNVAKHQKNNYSLDIDQVTPVNNDDTLDLKFLRTTYWDKNGKRINIDAAPNFGVYRLYRVQSKLQ